ncbi:pantothenate kinase [Myceligenerans xiligouense]|uniref:Pantothenate kinase n=1 Tax=Myceligenerans xiligouense TaxID=253184 RepID=A0A3N4Z9T5_9MICO|nr:pantothenate kinase [Myceligenerans xiligouense]
MTCWFAGLATLDVIHRAARPERDQKVTAVRQDVSAGGPAANAAVTAAALGMRSVLVTALGTSAVGTAARADLERYGVEVHDVARPHHDLAVSAVLVDDTTGERSVVSADGALTQVPGPGPDELAALPAPDVVLLDGHHPDIARSVLAHARTLRPRPLIVLDAGRWRPVFADLLPDADVIACSAAFRVPEGQEGWYAGLRGATVVTHGSAPVDWWDGDARGTIDVPAVPAVDTLGAGDAFHGALTAALARGAELPRACAEAVRVASLRVRYLGPRGWLAHLGGGEVPQRAVDETPCPAPRAADGDLADAGLPAVPADLVDRARRLADDPARSGRAVLGLTGPPGAGKSTLAAGLAAALGPDRAVVVGMDGFHLANAVLEARGSRERKGAIDTFDDAGYADLIGRIAAAHPDGDPVLAPEFRREIEEPIAGAVVVPPGVPLVITEGNYLLAGTGHWPRAREHMTEVWYVDVPGDVRLERLTARHHAHGKTPEAARAWARGSDQHNAEVVAATRDDADLHVTIE